jgi:alpha-D-xyloside xylohydrolase
VDFAAASASAVSWTAVAATQTDYFVTIPDSDASGSDAANQVMHGYVDAVGHVPVLPEYAAGYWHSRNRYASQDELLQAAEGFHNRSINVSVIVIDYNHWARMGDWSFDPTAWPDVPAMMAQLESYGMKVMVSSWPFSATNSTSFEDIGTKGIAFTDVGTSNPIFWNDNNCGDVGGPATCYIYDPTHTAARKYYWSRLQQGYYKHGIKIFWLDASEPEISTSDARAAAFEYVDLDTERERDRDTEREREQEKERERLHSTNSQHSIPLFTAPDPRTVSILF